ncbi:hypothetical protein [Polaromonas sp.]|uniref:hypothetical protein n=1 Tax=Polaromonas sp. TaxID=1869339 RepID=UPI0032637DF4
MKTSKSVIPMQQTQSTAPQPYIAMHAAGATAREVFLRARSDGYKSIDCAFIVAGLFDISFQEARRLELVDHGRAAGDEHSRQGEP